MTTQSTTTPRHRGTPDEDPRLFPTAQDVYDTGCTMMVVGIGDHDHTCTVAVGGESVLLPWDASSSAAVALQRARDKALVVGATPASWSNGTTWAVWHRA